MEDVVHRIQQVSQKMLLIQVGYLGNIPYQSEIKHSAQDLIPVVIKEPHGMLSVCIAKIFDKILDPMDKPVQAPSKNT